MQTRLRKVSVTVCLMVSLLVLAGCKLDMKTEAYVSDLREVAGGATGITTLTTLLIEIPSADECEKYSAQVAGVMQGLMRAFSPRRCEQQGMNSYLVAESQLPFVHSAEAWKQANSLFGVLTAVSAQDIAITLLMDLQKYEVLNQRMRDEFHQAMDLPGSKLTMVLNNDEREPSEYRTQAVFVDDQPIIEAASFELQRRQKAEIRLSNVSAAYLERNGSAPFFSLKNVKSSEPEQSQ